LKAFLKLDFESAIKIENFNDKQKNYHENFLPLLSFSLQLKYIIYYDVKKEEYFWQRNILFDPGGMLFLLRYIFRSVIKIKKSYLKD